MLSATILQPGCKVNIYLDIRGQRDDGRHDLLTLFLPLPEPHDTITIRPGPAGTGLSLACRGEQIDAHENILARAYRAFSECTTTALDLEVQLTKRIPAGAGLGGGSSDAATFLRFLNQSVRPSPMDERGLHALAATIGADVPFFLYNQPAWGEGIGDVLHPADIPLGGLHSIVVCPDTRISTAWAYQAWDNARAGLLVQAAAGLLTALELKDIQKTWPNVFFANTFEHVIFPAYPYLRNIKENLLACGASGAVLSGSGASLFAIFRDPRHMESASQWMGQAGLTHYKHSWQ